ncbi:MAG: VCBS repeat-containing protein, partial [Planctomycetes bacterium]|nr:VCBS repeat-containing protein [Planctomycetota bacterium]
MSRPTNFEIKPPRRARGMSLLVRSILALCLGAQGVIAQSEQWAYTRQMFPTTNEYPTGAAAGDIDGDGDLDLYIAVSTQGVPSNPAQDRLYLNDGRGRFRDVMSRLPVDTDDTYGVALGDLDGDGDLDVMLANGVTPCRIYLNDGAGNFQDAPALLPPQASPGPIFFCVALSDFDQDGDLDAFFAGETNRLWINQGPAGFLDVSSTNLPPPITPPVWTRDVAVGDLDGNGYPDLVLANLGNAGGGLGGGAANQILANVGGATFLDLTGISIAAVIAPTMAVDLGDIDGDGDLDIYFANNLNSGIPWTAQDQLYNNTGSGGFVETLIALPTETYSTNDAVFADFDGDGDLDVLTANGPLSGLPSEPDQILRNDGTGTYLGTPGSITVLGVELSTHRWVVGDFDRDGDLDGIAISGIETRLFLNRGDATLIDATNRHPSFLRGGAAVGDFDLDGIVDVAAPSIGFSTSMRQCSLLRGVGNGSYLDVSNRMPDIAEAITIAAGDMDRDGDLDLVIGSACFSVCRVTVLRNDGTGNFATWWSIAVGAPIAGVAFGDLDGDGLLDIVAGMQGGTPLTRVFQNRGASGFAEISAAVPDVPGDTRQFALGDLDGDGDLDLFVAKSRLGSTASFANQVYRNVGNGHFATIAGALPPHVEPSTSVALGDVDGDGDLDALVGNGDVDLNRQSIAVLNRLYLNNGNAIFSDASNLLPALPPDNTRAVALFDADEDGDLDAFLGNRDRRSRLYRNQGSGQFVDASAELPDTRAWAGSVVIADVDRDADLDIVTANLGSTVLFNLRRHLAWRTPQSLGKSFAMDLNGDPNAPWI